MLRILLLIFTILYSNSTNAEGTNIFGIGIYDLKFDGSEKNQSTDFRYEYRSDESLINIGPEEDNFFFLKPFFGFEYTNDSASYFLTGIYFEDQAQMQELVNQKNFFVKLLK